MLLVKDLIDYTRQHNTLNLNNQDAPGGHVAPWNTSDRTNESMWQLVQQLPGACSGRAILRDLQPLFWVPATVAIADLPPYRLDASCTPMPFVMCSRNLAPAVRMSSTHCLVHSSSSSAVRPSSLLGLLLMISWVKVGSRSLLMLCLMNESDSLSDGPSNARRCKLFICDSN